MKRKPCASCPFLPNNNEEFGVIAEKLCEKFNQPRPNFWAKLSIRENVKNDAISSGQLICHCSIYDSEMNMRPEKGTPCVGLRNYLDKNEN